MDDEREMLAGEGASVGRGRAGDSRPTAVDPASFEPTWVESAPGGPPAGPARRGAATAALLVVVVAASMQSGSALAVRVIDSVGVIEALWLRTAFAALILTAIRPRSLRLPAPQDRKAMLALVLVLMGMNLSFYGAISQAPVGIVVTIEFLGPLAVAVFGSRRLLDVLWVALAGVGVVLLAGPSGSASPAGLALSLAAGGFWAAFLLLAKRAVRDMEPLAVTTLMLAGSTVLLTPLLLVGGVTVVGHGQAVVLGLVVAVLSSALPYVLELVALRRVRAATYGVLLSIEPAVAAVAGYFILGQTLTGPEIVAIVLVAAAAAGASWTSATVEVRQDVLSEPEAAARSGPV